MMGFAARSTHPTRTLAREYCSPDINPAIRPYEFFAAKASMLRLARLSMTADKEPLV